MDLKVSSIVIAAIAIIVSLGFLLFFTSYWETVGWVGLWAYVGVMIAVFGALLLVAMKMGVEKNPLKTIDFAIIAMFVALMTVVDFGSMFVPGLTMLWVAIPQIAGAVLFYFPLGIAMAAALKLSPKPGSAFTLILVYSIIGQVFFFNPIWFARSIIAALAIEAFYLSSKRGTVSSLTLMGLMFGILYSVTGIIFQIYTWGYWQPLFVTLPEAVIAGVLMAVGSFLGFALGERAKTVMY
jgi:hypothetical protein